MLEGMKYLHAKFQINILENKKKFKLLELWTLLEKKEKENSEYKKVVITSLKIHKLVTMVRARCYVFFIITDQERTEIHSQ